MKLITLAQAIRDGKDIQIDVENAPDGGRLAPQGSRWRTMNDVSFILTCYANRIDSVRIKPELTPADLSVLIVSGIDCEFGGGSVVGIRIAPLAGIEGSSSRSYHLRQGGGFKGYSECRPRMSHWHSWQGGPCPLPEGFTVQVIYGNGKQVIDPKWESLNWSNNTPFSQIIAFKVTGLVDGYCWP